jgi:hypothetical protein
MRVSGVALRLDASTQLDIAKLDDDELEAFIAQGTVAVRVRHFANDDRLDFATPHARFRLYGNGRYRLDVDAEREETLLTVFSGTASMRSASGDIKVDAGGAIRVAGGPSASFVRLRAAASAFDTWTLARDKGWTETRSVQYVSTDMTGYEDLDRYGTWAQEPDYGAVWFPSRVSGDWVPYRQGHWDYVRPWGWTWIADEPWGYAPYHYGRWVYVRNRWGWYPGPRTARPAWAPALVAFVGGSNFSVGISGGSAPALGWYPLAPWERYEPWYRTNTAYVNRINVAVRDRAPRQWAGRDRAEWRYANRDQGATVVRRDAFAGRRNVAQDVIRVAPDTLRQAQVAQPTAVLPGPEQFRRAARPAAQPPAQQAGRPGTPSSAQAPQAPAPAEPVMRRPGERGGPSARPNFERRQAAPAPAPAPATATAQQPAPQQPAAAAAGRPFGRDDQRTQERAARDAQQQQQAQERAGREAQQQQQRGVQEGAAREAQQAQERAARETQQTQERAAREAQQQQQQQQQRGAQQQQQQQQQAQERAAREAQQAQERAARDQQQVQERARAQERAVQERQQQQQQQQQQAQERQQQQQQQAQERAAREAQRLQQQQQQAQERAAREAPRGQPAPQSPPPGREAAPAQPPAPQPAQPTAPSRGEPARGEQARGRDKDKDDDDKPGKGRGR